jgi:hypothetical protein
MKKTILILAVSIFIAGAMFTGCQSPAEKVKDAKEGVDLANQKLDEAIKDSIRQFKIESEETISLYDRNIAELRARLATANKDKKAQYEKILNELEQKNKQMKMKLQELKDDETDKWASFKREFRHDMDELGNAIKDLTVDNKK